MDHPDDLLESYAFGSAPEVGAHVASCEECSVHVELARQAAGWLALTHVAPPPSGLRSRVLAAAVAVRPPSSGSASSAYVSQVAAFGALIDSLSPSQWSAPTVDGRSVGDLVLHLAGNDGNVLADLGTIVPPRRKAGALWRDQSDLLLRTVAQGGDDVLARPVRMAGKVPARRPLREALTQRAFETWIHQDDIRAAVALPLVAPAPSHLARILGFGLALLPGAIDAAGRGRAGTVRLALSGPGGAEHVVGLSARAAAGGTPCLAEVSMPADRFGRLMAGRVPVTPSVAAVSGDRAAALDLLTVAATLGCE
ncbi:maleylpyruvate isomerase N-terminal domain-containing protein [Paractinoplanes globisporus]|uniref:Maleylpyruvate isomerase N-terminal domain-containing protein n=1 Tax=Paractinoplanes globisporus TaxID=113565 RepID=A0ABW6WHG8_9ACTN|nr:maleylpyruvate isomerase N-terminal domain-containing protein [Actinoplanes globisporus]